MSPRYVFFALNGNGFQLLKRFYLSLSCLSVEHFIFTCTFVRSLNNDLGYSVFPNIKSFERFRVFNRKNYREMTKLNLDRPVTKFYCVRRTDLLSMVHPRYADVQLPRFIAQKMKSRWDFEYGISEKKKENKVKSEREHRLRHRGL